MKSDADARTLTREGSVSTKERGVSSLVVYESMYGNTRVIAEAIADSEGPLEAGELERARTWGVWLACSLPVASQRSGA
jgi:hypothetical protein